MNVTPPPLDLLIVDEAHLFATVRHSAIGPSGLWPRTLTLYFF